MICALAVFKTKVIFLIELSDKIKVFGVVTWDSSYSFDNSVINLYVYHLV